MLDSFCLDGHYLLSEADSITVLFECLIYVGDIIDVSSRKDSRKFYVCGLPPQL